MRNIYSMYYLIFRKKNNEDYTKISDLKLKTPDSRRPLKTKALC